MYWGVEGLVSQGQLVDMVAQNPQREDSNGEKIASSVRAPKDLGQDVVVVLWAVFGLAELQKHG